MCSLKAQSWDGEFRHVENCSECVVNLQESLSNVILSPVFSCQNTSLSFTLGLSLYPFLYVCLKQSEIDRTRTPLLTGIYMEMCSLHLTLFFHKVYIVFIFQKNFQFKLCHSICFQLHIQQNCLESS